MNKAILGILVGLVLGAAGTAIYLKYPQAKPEQRSEKPAEASFLQHDADGRTLVKVDQETQTRMGLKVESLAAAQISPEVKGYGRVLDPAPLAALVTEATSAQASLEASTKEFERVKALYSQNQNASARALEMAEAAMKHDQISLASVQSRLLLGWGQAIASQADLATFVHSLAVQEITLVRVDLPLGERFSAPPIGGRIAPAGAPEKLTEAQYLGLAPSIDPQMQGQGFLFLAKAESVPVGAAAIAWLTVPGDPLRGIKVPEAAILRHQGEAWVYVQTDRVAFVRRQVTLNHPVEGGWLIAGELTSDERIVVSGAHMLLSEELKSHISLGD